MNNCKTCKHWNPKDIRSRHPETMAEMGTCDGIDMYCGIEGRIPDVWARVREKNQRILQSNMSADDKIKYTESPTDKEYAEFYEGVRNELRKELAFTEDASTYYAALITHEDFGCVKWEEK